ncbi:MAG: cell division protein ZipA [Pseudomonadota bacterium]
MVAELRVVLFILGLIVIAFVAWDGFRRLNKKKRSVMGGERLPQTKEMLEDFDGLGVSQVRRVSDRKEPQVELTTDNQQEIWFDDEKISPRVKKAEPVLSQEKPELVLVINVMAKEHKFTGTQILETLLPLGIRHGDMDIFHRYKNFSGDQQILFSVANATKPGSFDLNHMEGFMSSGLSFFLVLPGPERPVEALESMLDAVEKTAEQLEGRVLDSQRSVWTQQTKQHYKEQVLEYERKSLAKRKAMNVE